MFELRRIFLWLLILALPVQGYAAVAMLHCASESSHQGHDHAAHAGPQTGSAPSYHHEAHAHHALAGAQQAHSAPDVALHHEVSESAAFGDPADDERAANCTACDTCCLSSVSLPMLPVSLSAPDSAFAAMLWSEVSPPDVSRARLERPPRA